MTQNRVPSGVSVRPRPPVSMNAKATVFRRINRCFIVAFLR